MGGEQQVQPLCRKGDVGLEGVEGISPGFGQVNGKQRGEHFL